MLVFNVYQVVQGGGVIRVPIAHGEVNGHNEVQLEPTANVIQKCCVLFEIKHIIRGRSYMTSHNFEQF